MIDGNLFTYFLDNYAKFLMVGGPVVSYFLGRRQQKIDLRQSNAEATQTEIEGVSANFKLYQDIIDNLDTIFKTRIKDLEEELERLRVLNEELRKVNSDRENYIRKLKLKLETHEGLED